jgi:two-component system, response regulator YesN
LLHCDVKAGLHLSEKSSFRSKKSVFFTWLFSYIFILLIPIAISGLVYIEADKIVVHEINRTNSALLSQLKQLMDGRLEDIEMLGLQVALNTKTQSLMYVRGALQPYQHYTVAKLSEDFKLYKIANSFINRFYVHFNNIDYALSDQTATNSKLMYHLIMGGGNTTYEQWISTLKGKNIKHITLLPNKKDDGTVVNSIAYLQSLPMEDPNRSAATLVIMLDEEQVQEIIRSLEWTTQSMVIILDEQNNILASTQSARDFGLPRYEELTGSSGLVYNQHNSETSVVSYTSSTVNRMKYLSILPIKIYEQKVEYIRQLTAAGLLLCILLGGLVTYIFLRRNYNPVRELVQAVTTGGGMPPKRIGNEYKYIEEAISLTLNEKEKIKQKLHQQSAMVRSNFLMRLIKGRLGSNAPLEDILSSFGIRFESGRFAVILFYMEDYSTFLTPQDMEKSEDKLDLTQFVISNIVEELAGQNHQGFTAELDGMMACLVNFRGPEPLQAEKQDLLRIASESQKVISEKFHIYFTVAISDINESIAGIYTAYNQAVETLEYRLIKGREQILCYDEIKSDKSIFAYGYSLVEEQQLINCIKTGDYDKSEHMLKEVMKSAFSERMVPVQTAKCLIFDIVSTLLKTMDEMSMTCKDSFIEELNPVDRLLRCETLEDIQAQMMEILRSVCNYIEQKKNSHNHKMKKEILQYIGSYYNNENLSISGIADHFGLSLTYLSKFFKEQTGDGLLEYINRYRLEKAKQLLKESDENVSDIARKVGFYNSNALIRIFKKYEGITPGQYKGME